MHKWVVSYEAGGSEGSKKAPSHMWDVVRHRSVLWGGCLMGAEILTWMTDRVGRVWADLKLSPYLHFSPLCFYFILHQHLSLLFLSSSPQIHFFFFSFSPTLFLTILFPSLEHVGVLELRKYILFCSVWDFSKG